MQEQLKALEQIHDLIKEKLSKYLSVTRYGHVLIITPKDLKLDEIGVLEWLHRKKF